MMLYRDVDRRLNRIGSAEACKIAYGEQAVIKKELYALLDIMDGTIIQQEEAY